MQRVQAAIEADPTEHITLHLDCVNALNSCVLGSLGFARVIQPVYEACVAGLAVSAVAIGRLHFDWPARSSVPSV